MMMDISQYRHTFLFYFLSTLIPWGLWFFVAYISHTFPGEYAVWESIIGLLGLLAPFILALMLILPNKNLRQDFLGRVINLKGIRPTYLLISFLLMPLSILTAQFVSLFFGYSSNQFQFADGYSFTSGVFPVWFLLILAPLIEELAWHSYGTDCLRMRFNLFVASILFALYWGIWHIPLSFIKDYYHSNLAESGVIYSINFLVSLFPFVLIMNWLYYKTGRNIMVAIIFHITAGYFNEIFATHPMSKVIQTGLLLLVSIYLMILDKAFFFKK